MQLHLGRNVRVQLAQALFDPRPLACNQFARPLVVHRVLPCFAGQDPASVTYGPDAGSSQWMNGTSKGYRSSRLLWVRGEAHPHLRLAAPADTSGARLSV